MTEKHPRWMDEADLRAFVAACPHETYSIQDGPGGGPNIYCARCGEIHPTLRAVEKSELDRLYHHI